ncbi:hypothetical protein [Tautonia plasticadhaerens]|uniref:LTXXQ motif protein n=1 Tax=Tautonia plasticadhaerens TaxID=2527974 RepID=A0A518H569_9BACT|nr:hypothetical protein [Tautonia plasticadhaerens]QDV35984.1 hypothetical protein ElP_38940 [Tautonia plasticadhaerens]
MTRITFRAALVAAGLASGLLALAPSASAQVRRNIGGTVKTEPAEETPETPQEGEAPDAEPAEGEEGEEGEDRPEREVDPEVIARIVEMRGPMWLLEQEPVRVELKISDAQLERLKQVDERMEEVRDESRDRMREQMRQQFGDQGGRGGRGGGGNPAQGRGPGGFPGGPGGFPGGFPGGPGGFPGGPGGGFPGGDAFRTMMTQMRQQSDQALAAVLSPGQLKRFKQIMLQAKGPMVVTEDEMQLALGLLPVQREQIKMVEQEMEMKQQQASTVRRELFTAAFQRNREQQGQQEQQGQGGDRDSDGRGGDDERRGRFQMDPETQAKVEQLQAQGESYEKEALSKIGKVLNRSQINKYKEMLGKPFDFSAIDMGNAGRGFGGFGGGRGGGDDDGGRRRGG